MKILREVINKKDLLSSEFLLDGPMVKAVVDIEKEEVGIDSDLHADIESLFLSNGSTQDNLWGINLYPEDNDEDFIEFDSMINIRPRQGNRSRSIENEEIQNKVIKIVNKWINND